MRVDASTALGGTCRMREIQSLRTSSPLYDAVVEEIDGRRIRIGDRWLTDFASCNYLGFDLEPEIIDAVPAALRRWGTHPSWSRILASPRPYLEIEDRLTELLGAPDTLVLPTITHIHLTALPALADHGWIFLDQRAHKTLYEGSRAAAAAGSAVLQRYPADDLEALERLLRAAPRGDRKLICTDGVNSMTGNTPDLPALAALARQYDAVLYVDDAHGFGLIGERSPTELCPYGNRGNSLIRHFGDSYDNVILVGGFSKAYSSLLAFVAAPTELLNHLKIAASPYMYSGPVPVASLATTLAGFDVNAARGDAIRADLYRKTAILLARVAELGMSCLNTSGLPIVEIPVAEPDELDDVSRFLFDHGAFVTMAAYPIVPRADVGFRIQVTAANTDQEIEQLCHTLGLLTDRFRIQDAEAS